MAIYSLFWHAQHASTLTRRVLSFPFLALTALASGCMSVPPQRPMASDLDLADKIQTAIHKLPIDGLYEFNVIANGGHVTLAGRLDSPNTAKKVVTAVAAMRGVTQLSFHGLEFETSGLPDDWIASEARKAAVVAVGEENLANVGFYCEDSFLIGYGTVPSLIIRERIDAAVLKVAGVGKYHISCEVALIDPPQDAAVVQAVKKKLRNPFSLTNLTFKAKKIDIRSENNVVYLTGTTASMLGKLAAEQQAKTVKGVRYVVNQINVDDNRPAEAIVKSQETTPATTVVAQSPKSVLRLFNPDDLPVDHATATSEKVDSVNLTILTQEQTDANDGDGQITPVASLENGTGS